MGEDHHLPLLGQFGEHPCQPVDLRRVHALHRVVDHDEPERALRRAAARQERRQPERLHLALAHHAQRGAVVGAVHADREDHPPPGVRPLQGHRAELDVALLAQLRPDPLRVRGERRHPLVAQLGRRGLQPAPGGLQPGEGRAPAPATAAAATSQPRRSAAAACQPVSRWRSSAFAYDAEVLRRRDDRRVPGAQVVGEFLRSAGGQSQRRHGVAQPGQRHVRRVRVGHVQVVDQVVRPLHQRVEPGGGGLRGERPVTQLVPATRRRRSASPRRAGRSRRPGTARRPGRRGARWPAGAARRCAATPASVRRRAGARSRRRPAAARRAAATSSGVGQRQGGQPPAQQHGLVGGRIVRLVEDRGQRGQVGPAGGEQGGRPPGPVVIAPRRASPRRAARWVRTSLMVVVDGPGGGHQPPVGVGDRLQAEDRGDRVEELALRAGGEPAQLGGGEERPVELQRPGQTQLGRGPRGGRARW